MTVSATDHLSDQRDTDWSKALSTWSWLLPPQFTLWLVSRFGDLFIVLKDDTVHMLDVGAGTLVKVAESRDDFCTKIDEREKAAEWLMVPLVNRLVRAGNAAQARSLLRFWRRLPWGASIQSRMLRQILYCRLLGRMWERESHAGNLRDESCTQDRRAREGRVAGGSACESPGAGVNAAQARVIGFATPPCWGQYSIEKCSADDRTLPTTWAHVGSIHGQLRDAPDGAQVVLKVTSKPRWSPRRECWFSW